VRRLNVLIEGEANHAGTRPYAARRDAGAAAAKLARCLRQILQGVDPSLVGNAGVIDFEPGSPNVVPGRARLVVETRSVSMQSLDRAHEAVAVAALDPATVDAIARVCERSGRRWRRMVSWAGHDASTMATRVPAGMLFVPSHMGVSHSPLEHTAEAAPTNSERMLLCQKPES
jgi:N-carbamoyl-L-amino-acid hydrolase